MGKIVERLLLPAAIVALGLCVMAGLKSVGKPQRTVTVKGLSVREVDADKVTWPIVTKELGNDLLQLYQRINATNAKVKAFLMESGIAEGEIGVSAPEVVDLNAERYGADNKDYRYNVTSVITVTSTNVELVRSIMARQGELLKQGVAVVDGGYGNSVSYDYTAFQDMKAEMMEEAIKNAETTAKQFADNSHSSLGKIVTASQGQFSIDDRDSYTPHVKQIRVVTTVEYELDD